MENQKKEREITIGYLLGVFKKCVIFMVIAGVLFGALGFAYSMFIDKPEYYAVSAFCVTNNPPNDEKYTSSSLTVAAANIATGCVEIATQGVPVLKAVQDNGLVEKLGFENEQDCVKAVSAMISASKQDETSNVFYISVKSDSRETTATVANAIQESFPDVMQSLLKIDVISSVSGNFNSTSVAISKSSPVITSILFAFVAAVLVYCIFFVFALFDTSIYNENSIKENFDEPIIGRIPSFATPEEEAEKKKMSKLKKHKGALNISSRNYDKKLITNDSPFFVTESFNSLRTNVIFAATAAKNPIFAVTSDVAAAGKTVVGANLAIALSNLDKKVLLVECDMRCPAFSKLFGKRVEEGLSELLAGMVEKTESVVHKYEDTTLDILFCGKIPPNPSELLSSVRMKELAEEWKGVYDYVILDMPPLAEVYDAGVVSQIVNGYVVTVRANRSNVNSVNTVIDRINAVNGNIFGMVLNDINPKSNRKYKHYYSAYGEN